MFMSWEKLGVIGLCMLILVLVLLIMVCKLDPNCCLHKYCPFRASYDHLPRKRKQEKAAASRTPPKDSHPQNWSHFSDKDDFSEEDLTNDERNRLARMYPHLRDYDSISKPDDIASKNGHKGPASKINYGTVELSIIPELHSGKLIIKLHRATNLLDTEFNVDVCLKLVILGRSGLKEHAQQAADCRPFVIQEFTSEIHEHTRNPYFHETFNVYTGDTDWSNITLCILACNVDEYSHYDVISEVNIELADLDLSDETYVIRQLREPSKRERRGDLLLSLSYLPTSEKLSVAILQGRDMQIVDPGQLNSDILVKITTLHKGHSVQRQQVSMQGAIRNPVFHKSLVFDIPFQALRTVVMRVSVIQRLFARSEEDEQPAQLCLIGRLSLGHDAGAEAQSHWTEMMVNPRKSVSHWYVIR